MRLRYQQLFKIGLHAAYYVDDKLHNDFIIEPTQFCKSQLSRYKILTKNTQDGIVLLYECSPFTNDAAAFKPIATEQIFSFKVSVANSGFWYYADINNWDKDKIFLLKNTQYNTTGIIDILNGPLDGPILYRPMEFMYELVLDSVPNLLEIRDRTGVLIRTIIVRARAVGEPVGTKESFLIDLNNFSDAVYTLRHKSSGGDIDELVYCSSSYSVGTLAIIDIVYKGGLGWTGVEPFQKYQINITSRLTDWFIDVHIRKKALPAVLASELSLNHVPEVAEPVKTFSTVGLPDDLNGFVQFKSDVKLTYSQKPLRLRLQKPGVPNPVTVLDPLPLPSSISLQKDLLNNLFTRIIVNI